MDINARLEKLEREHLGVKKIGITAIDMDNRDLTGKSYDEITHDDGLWNLGKCRQTFYAYV